MSKPREHTHAGAAWHTAMKNARTGETRRATPYYYYYLPWEIPRLKERIYINGRFWRSRQTNVRTTSRGRWSSSAKAYGTDIDGWYLYDVDLYTTTGRRVSGDIDSCSF